MKTLNYFLFLFIFHVSLHVNCQTAKGKYFLTIDTTLQNKIDSLMKIANSYYMLGQLTISIEYYDKAITLNPNFAKAFFNRGNSFYDLGLAKQACDDWSKAKQLGDKEADMSFWKFCD